LNFTPKNNGFTHFDLADFSILKNPLLFPSTFDIMELHHRKEVLLL
jgi:hypothetical protein